MIPGRTPRAGLVALLLLTLSALPGCEALRGDSKDARFNPAPLPKISASVELRQLWSSRVDGGKAARSGQRLSVAVAGERAYIAGTDGSVRALDARSGALRWQVRTGQRISAGPGSDGSRVAVGTLDGELVVLDGNDGEQLWTHPMLAEVLTPPIVSRETIYAVGIDGRVHALEASSGKTRWTFDTTVPLLTLRGTGELILDGERLIVGAANGKVYALDIERGDVIWEAMPGESKGRNELERLVDVDGRLAVDRGDVFASAFQGKTQALTGDSGSPLWTADFGSAVGLAVDRQQVYVVTDRSIVLALDKRSGGEIWRQEMLKERLLSAPAVLGDQVVVGDYEGHLHLLNMADGQPVGRSRLGSDGFNVAPVVVDGVMYAVERGGRIAAFQLR
ncbi:MAG: outer membrane protein assembly factor BamB [Xanthomonadales bacterium]|jgi:outer membrane protein assembly factor BamB|nr:outer membrane protein assembly factor BamB [Xanthomonadales bacterium]